MKRVLPIILILFSITSGERVQAQFLLGQSSSNYAGVHGVYLNPATAADSRYKVQIHLAGFETYFYNNYLVWQAPYSPFQMMTNTVPSKYRGPNNGIIFRDQEYLREKLNGRDKHVRAGAEIRGPGVLFTINNKNAISINSRLRVGAAATNVSESVARLLKNGTVVSGRIEPEDFGAHLHANTNALVELSGTYARVLLDEEEEFIKVGITAKRLISLQQSHIHGQNINYEYITDPSVPNGAYVRLNNLSAQYGMTNEGAYSNASFSPAWLLGNASAGSGWGADLGFVYEYRPDVRKYSYREKGQMLKDNSKNKYLYRVSVSLLDIGRVSYKNPNYVEAYNLQRSGLILNESNFRQSPGLPGVMDGLNQTLRSSPEDQVSVYRTLLPTRLQASVDYLVKDKVYVNAMVIQGFVSNRNVNFTMPSLLAVTPRYEAKWFEVAVPFSLTDNYSRVAMGIGARAGILYVGSDNILPTFNIGNPKGMEFHFGLQIPIYRKPPESQLKCYPETEKRGIFGFMKKKRR
ncbi:DUF5723 family protein [Siphonobacter sp. SORGH_AS_1065]|uniref:DUF5723 family protein n=1 Tax=Siphonobacter sp. SORGH_AS_1065 TaxID=3041795 RepID=UPI0027815756|nr:DUF5723 family protein [Siphonobacter sp. SORGH_AS_1065]MDQ1088322.1 hypothetical protein [Siphonobacter sp. SORGH_AS_1065]